MTKLEAVNRILKGFGEYPIDDLDGQSSEIRMLESAIDEASEEIQLRGWYFNRTDNFELPVDTQGEIPVPNDVCFLYSHEGYVLRNHKVYDPINKTYLFKSSVFVIIIRILPFEDIPQTFQLYIATRAARKTQNNFLGSDSIRSFQEQDEMEIRMECMKEETKATRPSLLKGGKANLRDWGMDGMLRR